MEPIKNEIPCGKVIIGGLDGRESEAINGKGDRIRLRCNREQRGGTGGCFSWRGSGASIDPGGTEALLDIKLPQWDMSEEFNHPRRI